MIRTISVCAGIAVLIALWGCGGGSDTTTAGDAATGSTPSSGQGSSSSSGKAGSSPHVNESSSLDKAEYVKQANSICEHGKEKGLAEMGDYVKLHSGTGAAANQAILVEAVRKVFLPYVQRQIDELRALGAPKGERQQVEAFLNAFQQGMDQATSGSGASETDVFAHSFKRSADLARAYGIAACAYNR